MDGILTTWIPSIFFEVTMFKAMVLACALHQPSMCAVFEDEYGPYAERAECVERVEEITTVIGNAFPFPQTFSYRCEQQGEAT